MGQDCQDVPGPCGRLGQAPAGDQARYAQEWASEVLDKRLVPKPLAVVQFKIVALPAGREKAAAGG